MSDTPEAPPMTAVSPHLVCPDAAAAIDFYTAAFDAVEVLRLPGPGGEIVHAAVVIRGSTVMLVDEMEMTGPSPKTLGHSPVTLHLIVDDADAAIERALACGATLLVPAEDTFWGDRYGIIEDPSGHRWSIASPLGEPMTVEELNEAATEAMR